MKSDDLELPRIAVLIPCYNEEQTIGKVITDFRSVLPKADIYVFDNNSTDGSRGSALDAGAHVVKEKRQGKGFVVSAMLRKIQSDLYVIVDGDDTYPASSAMSLIQPLLDEDADMVVGRRISEHANRAFRPLHRAGNRLVASLINAIFGSDLRDPMSGFRAFTRDVALELPIVAFGFDVETEMTIQLLYRRFVIHEVPVPYRGRPEGSQSKLQTFRDGILVLGKIFSIARAYKPLTVFGGIGLLLVAVGAVGVAAHVPIAPGTPEVEALGPLALSLSCAFIGILSGAVGVIIHTLNFRLLELSSLLSRMPDALIGGTRPTSS